MNRRTFLVATWLFASVSLFGEPLCELKEYTFDDGYSRSAVNHIIQDSRSLIWMANRNGLTQFDGYVFRNFKSSPGDGCTMLDSRINYIAENAEGNIWCRSQENRAYLFNVRTHQFVDVLQPYERKTGRTAAVTGVFTLPKGVTWLACRDGNSYRVVDKALAADWAITMNGTKDNPLPEAILYGAFQDWEGDEWVLTTKGLVVYGKKKFRSPIPFQHLAESKQTVWLSSGDHYLYGYKKNTQKLIRLKLPSGVSQVNHLQILRTKELAFCTSTGLHLYRPWNATWETMPVPLGTRKQPALYGLYEDKSGNLWLTGTDPGVWLFQRQKAKVLHLQSPPSGRIPDDYSNKTMVTQDAQGTIWVLPRNGNFVYYDQLTEQLRYAYARPSDPATLISPVIRQYFTDKQGNIWLAGSNRLFRVSTFERHHRFIEKEKDELEYRTLMQDRDKRLWVGVKNQRIRIFDAKKTPLGYLDSTGTLSQKSVSFAANVYALMQDRDGSFWLGTRMHGLYQLIPKQKGVLNFTVRHYKHEEGESNSLSDNNVYDIHQDSRGRIWVATYGGGLNLLQKNRDGSVRFIHSGNQMKHFPMDHANRVRCIVEGKNGVMLLGTMNGLISFSLDFDRPENIRFYWNTRRPDVANTLSNNDVMDVFIDSREQTYVMTQNGGVDLVLNRNLLSEHLEFKHLTEGNGLYSDQTLSMVEDKSGCLWIVSLQGLTRFRSDNWQTVPMHAFHYRREVAFTEASALLSSDGSIVLGSDQGLLTFNPSSIHKSNFVPNIVFTSINVQGEHSTRSPEYLNELILKPSQRNLSIGYAALDYRNPPLIRYAYRLDGFEENWHQAGDARIATYNNLPPGKYTLQVRSTNSDGAWVPNLRQLSVRVLPTFWESGWAWIVYVLLFLSFFLLVLYLVTTFYRLKKDVETEKLLSATKLNFFTDISHELRTPLTLIAGPVAEVLDNEEISVKAREHLSIVRKNTERMLRMVNQILDFRKIQYRKMHLFVEKTDVVTFLSRIMESFQLLAEEKNIAYRMDTAFESLYLWVDRDKFEKIMFNLLSNAFKYTSSGKTIRVELKEVNNQVLVSVLDEGQGFVIQKIDTLFQRFETLVNQNFLNQSTGIGLSLVKELLTLHHASIKVESQPGVGSAFHLYFEKGKDHFLNDEQVEFVLADEETSNTPLGEAIESEVSEFQTEGNDGENVPTVNHEGFHRILVVEDNEELLRFLTSILEKEFQVLQAKNGKEGLEKVRNKQPDLIVSDVMMPLMDGFEMVRHIKENPELCHIPIVLLTARESVDDRIQGVEQGVDDYITKPFSAHYLKTRLFALIKQRRELQNHFLSEMQPGSGSYLNRLLSPSVPILVSHDEIFIRQLMESIEQNIDNESLTVMDLAKATLMSRAVFYQKVRALLGVSPIEFIRDIRVKRAVQLLDSGMKSLSEVAYSCGFGDPNYFTRCFKKKMGMTPSEYRLRGNRPAENN